MAKRENREEQGINPEVEEDGRAHLEEMLEADEEFRQVWEANRARRELGMLLLEKRLERGLTQRELADRIGTSQNRVYLLENGETNPTLDTLQRLAAVLGFTLEIRPQKVVAS
jgi:DNA-binding XRE family transcriptional regulator